MPQRADNVLEVKDLRMWFPVRHGLLKRKVADVKAVDGVTFDVRRGETLGLVGESGSGKTTVGRCLVRLYKPTAGRIFFEGRDISRMRQREFRPLRHKISLIFQDPYGSLDPRQTAEQIVGEPLLVQKSVDGKKAYKQEVERLLTLVQLDPSMARRYPHEFSGGQRQRIGIARALAGQPSVVVCDEPISALDVSIQAQIVNMLSDFQTMFEGLSYVFIAHDLSVIKHISDRIAVMYLGKIVEITTPDELYGNPLHPYTEALLSAIPIPDPLVERTRKRILLEGEVPSPIDPPSGCPFHPRCFMAVPVCSRTEPSLVDKGGGHEVACLRR